MKKQKFISKPLKFKKINIAYLNAIKGSGPNTTLESQCCSKPPFCVHTVTTRPDSLNPKGGNKNSPS